MGRPARYGYRIVNLLLSSTRATCSLKERAASDILASCLYNARGGFLMSRIPVGGSPHIRAYAPPLSIRLI